MLDWHESGRFVFPCFLELLLKIALQRGGGEKGEGEAALWGSAVLHTGETRLEAKVKLKVAV